MNSDLSVSAATTYTVLRPKKIFFFFFNFEPICPWPRASFSLLWPSKIIRKSPIFASLFERRIQSRRTIRKSLFDDDKVRPMNIRAGSERSRVKFDINYRFTRGIGYEKVKKEPEVKISNIRRERRREGRGEWERAKR